jgi:hydantoinase/carbamoylase family amidase
VAGLDAAAAIGAGSVRRTIAVVAFRLEEGCRFGRGVFGSRAMVGDIEPDEGDLLDADGISVAEAFAELGLGRLPTRGWADPAPACFVETHIEQGPALAAAGAPLGVVTSIAGMAGFDVVFSGSRGHAGTVPMSLRSDALGAAARFVLAAHEVARSIPGAVATIGRLVALPGATNTIPGRAELFADLRAPDAAGLDALVERTTAAAAESAAAGACTAEVLPRWRYEPVAMDPTTAAAVRRAVAGLGLDPVDLPSGAGHDAAIMATAGIPSAMLFVRSDAGGVSHAPEESTGADAIALCTQALESALRELAA